MHVRKFNNWNVPYSCITFFEKALNGHDKVSSVEREKDILFRITLESDAELVVLLLYEYVLGVSSILAAKDEFPEAEYIVTGANWNGYTKEAKEYGGKNSIGIFNSEEFFGALNWKSPKTYHKKDQHGKPIYAYKTPKN